MAGRTPSTGTPSARPVFDYSYDGVRRSVEHSLKRLGLDRVDILYIHDPDDHWKPAISEAYPALHRLREEGVVGAIGAAMDQAPMLARFAREGDFDVFLIAGRYTLLDQEGLHELLPLCAEKRIGVVIGGVMNSGILADPRPGSAFDYRPAAPRGSPGPSRSAPSANGTAYHSRPRRSSSRSPIRPSPRLLPASVESTTSTSTRAHAPPDPRRVVVGAEADGPPAGDAPTPGEPTEGRPSDDRGRRCARPLLGSGDGEYPWMTGDYAAIRRRFGPEDLRPELAARNVASILVQTRSSLDETPAFLALADATEFIAGVVGWVDLVDPSCRRYDRRAPRGPGGDNSSGSATRSTMSRTPIGCGAPTSGPGRRHRGGRAGLRPAPPAGAPPGGGRRPRALPDLRFVVDHLAKPPIASGRLEPWVSWLRPFGELANVWCKISGMVTEADPMRWRPADLQPFVDSVLDVFGPARLLFGSDWPVCLLVAPYEAVFDAAVSTLRALTASERDAVFGGTAGAAYRLELLPMVDRL